MTRRFLIIALALVATFAAHSLFAADAMTMTGTIKAIDLKANTVTVANDSKSLTLTCKEKTTTITLDGKVSSLSALKVGNKVTTTFVNSHLTIAATSDKPKE